MGDATSPLEVVYSRRSHRDGQCTVNPRQAHMLSPLWALLLVSQAIVDVRAAGCGERTTDTKVVGGTVAEAKRYPWFVALVPSGSVSGSLTVLCGATLISPTHLLTAAHCFNGIPVGRQKDAFRPTFILEDRCKPLFTSMSTVSSVVIHPQFNYLSLRNDIAVMTLQSPVNYTQACLPPTRPNMRGDGTVVGYGNTATSGVKDYPCQLREAEVRLYTRNECLRTANFLDIVNLPNVFCAGRRGGGVDTCDGDSGGPLLRVNTQGRYYVQGITSFGHGCARPNNPGVYTDVSKYLNWIRKTTGLAPSQGTGNTRTVSPRARGIFKHGLKTGDLISRLGMSVSICDWCTLGDLSSHVSKSAVYICELSLMTTLETVFSQDQGNMVQSNNWNYNLLRGVSQHYCFNSFI